MREPRFWARNVDPKSREAAPLLRLLLTPLAWISAAATHRRLKRTLPHKVSARVICIGNLTAGGVGKSPVVAALRDKVSRDFGLRTATLSRGYKGKLTGPLRVDPSTHSAADVGDEPLMLAASGEAWIGADRAASGQAMSDEGIEVILMDDGHQNPGLHKDCTLIVVDSEAGFGNGFVIPKGPLREPVHTGLKRAQAIVVLGAGTAPSEVFSSSLPILSGEVIASVKPPAHPYVAFAGIGRPEKFFDTLASLEVDVRDAVPFADHHAFTDADLKYLRRLAEDNQARLITTEKDFVRLPVADRTDIETLPIQIQFKDLEALDKLLEGVIKLAANG